MSEDPILPRMLDFCAALMQLKEGAAVRRDMWPPKLSLQISPDGHSFYMTKPDGDRMGWTLSTSDILATDWLTTYPVQKEPTGNKVTITIQGGMA